MYMAKYSPKSVLSSELFLFALPCFSSWTYLWQEGRDDIREVGNY
jgi:hypothetical protein